MFSEKFIDGGSFLFADVILAMTMLRAFMRYDLQFVMDNELRTGMS